MNDVILSPAHYTVYPVQPIEITRHLGFCLGNATKYVLRAPYKGGVEDCLKAQRYLAMEMSEPFPLPREQWRVIKTPLFSLMAFFKDTPGDRLWEDVAAISQEYLLYLFYYITKGDQSDAMDNMQLAVQSMRRVLTLRDTTGQIYEGMSGLPQAEAKNAQD